MSGSINKYLTITYIVAFFLQANIVFAQLTQYEQMVQEGNALIRAGNADEAEEILEKAIELEPKMEDAYLSLGFLYYAQREWSDAKTYYGALLDIYPDHLMAHYYHAMCDREHGRTIDPARRFFIWNSAEDHFEYILTKDSSYREVLNEYAFFKFYQEEYKEAIELCLRQIFYKPDATRPKIDIFKFYDHYVSYGESGVFGMFRDVTGTQLDWFAERVGIYDQYFLGEKYRRIGEYEKADSILTSLINRKLIITKIPIYLSRVRLYYQMNRDAEAEQDYWTALGKIQGFHELKFIYDDTKLIMEDSDLKISFPTISKIREYYQQFWDKRNPFTGSSVNIRLAEHYRRLIHAEESYKYEGLRLVVHDPDIAGVLAFPEVYFRNDKFNDKGLVYVRYGEPDDVAVSVGAGSLSNESWLYHQSSLNPKLIFHFEIHQHGRPDDWRLVPVPTDPAMLESRLGWDPLLDKYYMAQTELDRLSTLSEIQSHARPSIYQAMGKDRPITLNKVRPVQVSVSFARFLDDMHESFIDVFLSVQKSELFLSDSVHEVIEFESGFAIQDTSWKVITKKHKNVELTRSDTSQFIYNQFIDVNRAYNDLDRFYLSSHIIELDSAMIGGYRYEIESDPFEKTDLIVSDILLSYQVEPSTVVDQFTRHGLRVVPNPSKVFERDEPVYFYYEIYNLDNQSGMAEFEVEQIVREIETEKGFFGKIADIFSSSEGQKISITKQHQSKERDTYEYTAFDFSEWDSGPIEVEIRITDKSSGKAISTKEELTLN